jgi:CBS domain-containing protein
MKVSNVMSKAVVVDDTITLRKAASIMSSKNIANVVVIKDGKIKGYVSERDVLSNLEKLDKPVTSSMSRGVVTVSADAEISEAGRIMTGRKLKRLPVMKNGKLVGAISFRDVIRYSEKGGSGDGGDFFFN